MSGIGRYMFVLVMCPILNIGGSASDDQKGGEDWDHFEQISLARRSKRTIYILASRATGAH
jgi:hypothetical protein